MAFSKAGSGPFRAEMNLTPMIDVLLVLIIIFMVAVSSIQKKGLAAEIPQPADKHSPEIRTIVIQVRAAGDQQLPALNINDEKVTWGDLQNRLVDIFKRRAERVAFVQGDDGIDYQYIADAISIARSSGVDRIGLLPRSATESR
ncbi:MAG TPA: biopolymer transporter ExbD [Terriglobales bacterium]|nr:biopolymer transporter ExbD [Terriglobales bacterium]